MQTTETAPTSAAFVSLIKGTNDDHHGNGSIGDKPLALVGVGLRQSRRWLKRAMPTDARGRCPQKNKWTDNLPLVCLSIICPLKFNFCRQRLRASAGAVRLSRCLKSLNTPPTNAKGLLHGNPRFVSLIKGRKRTTRQGGGLVVVKFVCEGV